MKILHVIANLAPRYGGPSKACVEMARATARLGHQVSIFTTNQDGPTELDVPVDRPVFKDSVEIRYFPIQFPRFFSTSWPMARALQDILPEFDIVHIHSLYLFHGAVAAYYCRKYGIPYLIRPHGTLDPYLYKRHRLRKNIVESLFENRNLQHAAAIHFTTEEEKELAQPYVFGIPGIVIPNGIDISEYENLPDAGTFRTQYPELKDKKIVLFLGRLNFKKGLDILTQAFAMVAEKREDVRLVIAGPDNDGYGKQVKSWLQETGVLDRVLFTGMLQGRDKLAALRDADLFVLPSYSENFGIAVVEAMASGIPVVISDKVNIWREVKKYGAGKIVSCDAEQFAEAIIEILQNDDQTRRMGENGRELVSDFFQWDKIAVRLEEEYGKILSGEL